MIKNDVSMGEAARSISSKELNVPIFTKTVQGQRGTFPFYNNMLPNNPKTTLQTEIYPLPKVKDCTKVLSLLKDDLIEYQHVKDEIKFTIANTSLSISPPYCLKLLVTRRHNVRFEIGFDFERHQFLARKVRNKIDGNEFDAPFFQELKNILQVRMKDDHQELIRLVSCNYKPLYSSSLLIDQGIATLKNLLDFIKVKRVLYCNLEEEMIHQLEGKLQRISDLKIDVDSLNFEDITIANGLALYISNLQPLEDNAVGMLEEKQSLILKELSEVFEASSRNGLSIIAKEDFESQLIEFTKQCFAEQLQESQKRIRIVEKIFLHSTVLILQQEGVNDEPIIKLLASIGTHLNDFHIMQNNIFSQDQDKDFDVKFYQEITKILWKLVEIQAKINDEIKTKAYEKSNPLTLLTCQIYMVDPLLLKHNLYATHYYTCQLEEVARIFGNSSPQACLVYLKLAALFFADDNLPQFLNNFRDYESVLNVFSENKSKASDEEALIIESILNLYKTNLS